MGKAKFRISFELLTEALHLPSDSMILSINTEYTYPWLPVAVVESPDIPDGDNQWCRPTLRTQEPTILESWNVESEIISDSQDEDEEEVGTETLEE